MTLQTQPAQPVHGLSTLSAVSLSPEREEFMRRVGPTSQGSPAWRARKPVEARELLALETIAPRIEIIALDLTTELLAIVRMAVTVPCLARDGELVVVGQADLALCYPEEILHGPLPGYALVQIHRPRRVWHPNVSDDVAQRICLGANVPKGYPLREAVLGSYAALTLQSISLDQADPAGIMNPAALSYWNDHKARIPLSTAAFLDPPASAGARRAGGAP